MTWFVQYREGLNVTCGSVCEHGSINTGVLEQEFKRTERCGRRGANVNVCPSGSCKSINVRRTVCFKTKKKCTYVCLCECVWALKVYLSVSTHLLIVSLTAHQIFFFFHVW